MSARDKKCGECGRRISKGGANRARCRNLTAEKAKQIEPFVPWREEPDWRRRWAAMTT